MFYIVETKEQLGDLFYIGYDNVFIEPIYYNDYLHPVLNQVSLLYIKPLNNDKGYIVCLDHSEALSIDKVSINTLLSSFNEIYVRDRKSFIYHFPVFNVIDISFDTPEYQTPTIQTHEFFYQRYGDKLDINTVIPITKHYEKCEYIFDKVKEYCVAPPNVKFHNKLTSVFYAIEQSGIKINPDIFNKHFELNNEDFSLYENTIYTQYNLYNITGRPSNRFNGINFAALNKDDGCRDAFIPENDYFLEIDITAYHPTLAAQLVNFNFEDETPYQYFAREANVEINEAKILMFKQLYGGVYKEYQYIEFFQLIQKYIDKLWDTFQTDGFVECSTSGHKFTKNIKDLNPQKLFNYTLQNLETSTNVLILWNIIRLLRNKSTKVVLYTYDSILLDYKKDEDILEEINEVFTKFNLKTKTTKGSTYGSMSLN
jgi:hypothetical protein